MPKFELLSFASLPVQRKQIVLRAALEFLITADWNYLLENPRTAPLYESAPHYVLKVRPGGLDAWQDIPQTIALGSGDCKDFACLSAHLRVATKDKGEVAIANIKAGDFVATRFGWKRVAGAMLTRANADVVEATLSNGRSLIATPDHLVWTEGRKFIPLGEVRPSDRLLAHDDGDGSKAKDGIKVLAIKSAPRTDVYDLAVEDVHEFFCEGALVHNCWRVAELRNAGYDDVYPHIKVSYHEDPSGREPMMTVYHIQVRIHDIIEDPSAILGMPKNVSYDQLKGDPTAIAAGMFEQAAGMFEQETAPWMRRAPVGPFSPIHNGPFAPQFGYGGFGYADPFQPPLHIQG